MNTLRRVKLVAKTCGLAVLGRVSNRRLSRRFKHMALSFMSQYSDNRPIYTSQTRLISPAQSLFIHSQNSPFESVLSSNLSFIHWPYYYDYYVYKIRCINET